MTKGIRAFTNDTFNATLPQLADLGPAGFRREVMALVVVTCDISIASAATHYNHSLKVAKATNPEAVASLGRSEDKKGGRKPIHTVDVIRVKTGEVVAVGVSKAKAEALIARATAARKAKLAVKADAPVTEVADAPVAEMAAEAVAA